MLFGLIPLLLRIDSLKLVIKIVELRTDPLNLLENKLKSFQNGIEFMLPKHYNLLVFHLLLLLPFVYFLFLLLLLLLLLVVIMDCCLLLNLLLCLHFLGLVWWLVSYNWHGFRLLSLVYLRLLPLGLLSRNAHWLRCYVLLLYLVLGYRWICGRWICLS